MAVYTEIGDEELSAFLARYDVGALVSYKGIAEGVENTNYLVQTQSGRFILTLYEKRVDPSDLPFFLGLMQHLAARGVSCPLPVADRFGQCLSQLAGRSAAMVTFLDGFSIHRPRAHHCAAVGAALAQLHLAGGDFGQSRANTLGEAAWRPLFERLAPQLNTIEPGLEDLVVNELAHLEAEWPRDLPTGVIHADLFPDNVFFLEDRLTGLIDFYFACHDALAYDLAICLNAWCFSPAHTFEPEKGRALLAGYERVRPLTMRERDGLPVLARGAAVRFLLTRAQDWLNRIDGALVAPHDPRDYIHRLRFHQTVQDAATYGLEGCHVER